MAAEDSGGNKFNFQDMTWEPAVFFGSMVLMNLYIIYRYCCIKILEREWNTGSKAWGIRKLIVIMPISFNILLQVRTWNHYLNNACAGLVPLAYLFRLMIHSSILTLLLLAIVPLLLRSDYMTRRPARVYQIFFLLSIPGLVFVSLLWIEHLGIQKEGVCTIGRRDGSDWWHGVSRWVWYETAAEACYLLVNIVAVFRLQFSSSTIRLSTRRELRMLIYFSSFLITWDVIFRFDLTERLVAHFVGVDSEFYKVFAKFYAMAFAIVYVNGMSGFISHCIEYNIWRFFRPNPFSRSFYRMLRGKQGLPPDRMDAWVARLREERAKRTVPGGDALLSLPP